MPGLFPTKGLGASSNLSQCKTEIESLSRVSTSVAEKNGDSTDSLVFLSQQTCDSQYYGEDISDLIRLYDMPTPPLSEGQVPISATPSTASLGKRKASELSDFTNSPSACRPTKIPKFESGADDDNPFLDTSAISPEPVVQDPGSPVIISHSMYHQRCINSRKLPYGVQFEIARLVTSNQLFYEDILMEDLDKLQKLGSNVKAVPAISKVILARLMQFQPESEVYNASFAKEIAAKSPWAELDKEEEALSSNTYGGLGFLDERPDWYGGQVHFRGTLKNTASKGKRPEYKVTLERAELGSSNHFARRFGSKNFLRLRIQKTILNKNNEDLIAYLTRPFILCDGVFRAFFAKDTNVFFIKTNEVFDGSSISPTETIPGMLDFSAFLDWHNPIELNSNQTMAKWASRFALGLSNSAPGIQLEISSIHSEPDITSEGSDMTDGAGTINRAGLRMLRQKFNWDVWPTAIQVRIFGAKGLLVEDPHDVDEAIHVRLRPSQMKIQYPKDVQPDPTHLIIDVLRSSHSKSPCRLSVETIMNLSDNGVPASAFIRLLRQGLHELVTPLMTWEGDNAMFALWSAVCRVGGVMSARRAREDAGLARVKGYADRDAEEVEYDDEDGLKLNALEQRSSAWWNDEISGCPSSLEETVMCLLDSGFTPQNCAVLRDKLKSIIKSSVKHYTQSYRLDIPMSVTAFLVPDTEGILEHGEIFFRSSKQDLRNADGSETDIVVGDILLTRHPCKLPTDVQKWKAVNKPELRHFTDVIVCSTKGTRRAADFLAGGDYDGDKGLLIYQPELVQHFVNAPLHFSVPPPNIQKRFSRHNEKVQDFLRRTGTMTVNSKVRQVQTVLLGAIRDTSVVGKYSTFHENAVYTKGYRHGETTIMGYMFTMTLDGSKTGLTVLPQVLKDDTKKYQSRPPVWKETDEEKKRYVQSEVNEINLARPPELGPYIMDILHSQAKKESDRLLGEVDKTFEVSSYHKPDPDLTKPWYDALAVAERWANEENSKRMQSDLEKIAEHVRNIYTEHRSQLSVGSPRKAYKNSPKKDKGAAFTDLPIEVRQDKIRALSKKYASMPPPSELLLADEEIARVKASYAYVYDSERGNGHWTRFPWDIAMRELCAIKARATGRYKTVSGGFYDHFNIKPPRKHHV